MSNTESVPRNEPVQISMDEIHSLFVQRRCDEISEQFLKVLENYNSGPALAVLTAQEMFTINQFVKLFHYIISEPAFVISERFWVRFFSLNHVISNLVAISSHKNTDA